MSSEPASRPLILQRADPCIRRHEGWYYFTASVPEYDRLELRRSRTITGLAEAPTRDIWRKVVGGPCSALIWAPEIHRLFGSWWVYFAAAPSAEIKDGLFQHRMYAIGNSSADPLEGQWSAPVRVDSDLDSFSLDATTFEHRGQHFYVWAQKDPAIAGNSNLYIARLATATTLATAPVRLSVPEFEWETRGFLVNEGPSVVIRRGRVFLSYSASATDENYCLGLLQAPEEADLLDPRNWQKSPRPVFQSDLERGIYGPGHNGFTIAEDGSTDLLVFHARTYTNIVGDPLWDPNRHTFVKRLHWDKDGQPVFGKPSEP